MIALRDALNDYCAVVLTGGYSLVRNSGGDFHPAPDQRRMLRRFPQSLTTLFEWSNGAYWVKDGQEMPFLLGYVFDGAELAAANFQQDMEVLQELNESGQGEYLDDYFGIPVFGETENTCFGFLPDKNIEEMCCFNHGDLTRTLGVCLSEFIGLATDVVSCCVRADPRFWDRPIFDLTFDHELYSRLGLADEN